MPDVSLLDRIRIASPCTVSWASMRGDDRVRFCEDCKLNVYNLSAMPTRDAERLILESEGRLCGMLYRRRDGTVISQDCPVGLARTRAALARGVTIAGGLLTTLVCAALAFAGRSDFAARLIGLQPFQKIVEWLDPIRFASATAGEVAPMPGSIAVPIVPSLPPQPPFQPAPRSDPDLIGRIGLPPASAQTDETSSR